MGRVEVVQLLLAAEATVSAAAADGRTPLYDAASCGETEIVQMLLAAGGDVNAASSTGSTPLHAAAESGYDKVVQLLLAAGANVDAEADRGSTPLHLAATSGRDKVVQLLLRKGASPQHRDAWGSTAVYWSAAVGFSSTVQLLLEAWGQPQIPAVDLIAAAKVASKNKHMVTFARLAKELRRLYPAEVHQLFQGRVSGPAAAAAAVLDAWASDVSSLDEQRAAVRKREEDVASEKQAVQQLMWVWRAWQSMHNGTLHSRMQHHGLH